MSYLITREIAFDAGHRIPQHDSKCRNPHGHRYRVQGIVEAEDLVDTEGSNNQMVADFSMLKQTMTNYIHDVLDHGFICWKDDPLYGWLCNAALKVERQMNPDSDVLPGWKVIQFPYIPTAENIAKWCFWEIETAVMVEGMQQGNDAKLVQVNVWETPNAMASYTYEPIKERPSRGQGTFQMKVQ